MLVISCWMYCTFHIKNIVYCRLLRRKPENIATVTITKTLMTIWT